MPERPFKERPIKVRLVLLDTEYAGKRFRVDGQPFVLGRHDDCDLQLQSSSLSRRHCEIVVSDETPSVLVRDLNSRNGTLVNDRKLGANESVQLFHHDVLRIGRLSFRLSVKYSVTGEPLVRGESGKKDPLSSLLSELDEMAEDTSFGTVVKASGLLEIPKQESRPARQEFPTIAEEPAESTIDPNMETVQMMDTVPMDAGPMDPEGKSGQVAEASEAAEPNPEEDESSKVKVKKEPMKLPEHLRRRSADSQEAATEALKRLFSGGY